MVELYKKLNEVMRSIEEHLYIKEIKVTNEFYRIRVGNKGNYSRKDLFHIPMSKRELIRSYRYSISGYPCLYLANYFELSWFECGMPKKFNFSKFKFNPRDKLPLRLIDFSKQPRELIGYILDIKIRKVRKNFLIIF